MAATTLWRQCIDMLAQYDQPGKVRLEQDDRVALVSRLNDLRGALSEGQRIASVVELGGRLRSPALVEFFSSDKPSVCAVAMARAQLPDMIWPVLLSRIGPTARGVLRGRRDIGERTRLALEAFGSVDFVLQGPDKPALASGALALVHDRDDGHHEKERAATPAVDKAEEPVSALTQNETVPSRDERSQIKRLVERIERFTSARPRETFSAPDLDGLAHGKETLPDVPGHFPFETDSDGHFTWVGSASRTALVGLSIGQPALPGETGPDGHVAGAFARRTSFQHGRLFIGEGAYRGEWRLSAVPFFDPATGRFQGYRGQSRRPLAHETPQKVQSLNKVAGQAPTLDSMRQIVHELRTPLNAILGFAEIIEKQLFGPADAHYRDMAGNIMSDARQLMTVFDDIDLAARSAATEAQKAPSHDVVDIGQVMENVVALYRGGDGGATVPRQISLTLSTTLPMVQADPVQAERMVQHLVRTLVSVAGEEEVVNVSLWFQPYGGSGHIIIGFDRPRRLIGLSEKEILDPGYGVDGDWPDGPLLGLGFSMRLVRSLVQGQGGSLIMDKDRLLLELPVVQNAAGHEAG